MSQNELLSPITRTPEQKLEQYTNISSEQLSELKGNLIYRLVGDMSKEQLVQFTYLTLQDDFEELTEEDIFDQIKFIYDDEELLMMVDDVKRIVS